MNNIKQSNCDVGRPKNISKKRDAGLVFQNRARDMPPYGMVMARIEAYTAD
jgi:hypothetical protein